MSIISLYSSKDSNRPLARCIALVCVFALVTMALPAPAWAQPSPSGKPSRAAQEPAAQEPAVKENPQESKLREISPDELATCGEGPQRTEAAPRQCRAPNLGAPGARDAIRSERPIIKGSVPGPWVRDLKDGDYSPLTPGEVVSPTGDIPYEVSTRGRWLPGYVPGTPEAQREFYAWQERERRRQAALGGSAANRPASPIDNAWSAGISESGPIVDEEPITTFRHPPTAPASVFNPIEAEQFEDTGKSTGAPSDYHSSGLTNEEYRRLKELVAHGPLTPEAQAAEISLEKAGSVGVQFDAIVSNFGSVPPDPIMAAGPNHLVAIVNTRYQVYDKTGGALTSDITLNTFFQNITGCSGSFDPFIAYDEQDDRFVMGSETILGNGDSYLCFAATATGDPTGAWNRYSFRADANFTAEAIDYPHMGIGLSEVFIAGNMFADSGAGFQRILAFAINKDALYAGTPLDINEANLGGAFFTGQPVKLSGFNTGQGPAEGTPHHIISHQRLGLTRIWAWDDAINTLPTVLGDVSETYNGFPPNAPEQGGGNLNDTGSGAWFDAEERDGKIYASRGVGCNIGGGSSEACVDWVVIDVSGGPPALLEQQQGGAFGTANEFRYYPDIAVDRNGNLLTGYTKSSDALYTGSWVAGREAGDPAGTLQTEQLMRQGLGNYSDGAGCGDGSCDRWGDYTGMTIDPDGCTFWYLGQYSDGGAANWGTHIGSFKFDSCSVESAIGVDRGVYGCSDTVDITVQDVIRIDASTVAAATTITTSSGDSETVLAGDWIGTDCIGADCGTWMTSLPTSDAVGSSDDGVLNVANGGTITTDYVDPHVDHTDQSRTVPVVCQTGFEDGGFIIDGGCENGEGTELYRDYMDAGEQIAYTAGLFNPPSALALTDVSATLQISGPAAGLITIHNPTVYIGSVGQGSLAGAVFNLSFDPSIDSVTYRLSEHDFNISVTSIADGLSVPQVVTQLQLVQTDDNIVPEAKCFNMESDEGFVNERFIDNWTCGPTTNPPCSPGRTVNTVTASWTRGDGCGSETRTDVPTSTCDVGGTNAYKTNNTAGSCGTFAQSLTTLTDDVLYSPIFSPAQTGEVAGQPWNYQWLFAEWFRESEGLAGTDVAFAQGQWFSTDYTGVADPAPNEIETGYDFFSGYSSTNNVTWDSGTAWDPDNPPANYTSVAFDGAGGLSEAGLEWRMAFEVYDADYGAAPEVTPATTGLAIDNLSLVYDLYHAEAQVGTCTGAAATVSFDQFSYQTCGSGLMELQVLDPDATGPLTVTVTSDDTTDSETVTLTGTAPYFTGVLSYDTGGGISSDDGVLFVTPSDIARVSYDDASTATTVENLARVICSGGAVLFDGITVFQDNGDSDPFADTNESVELALQLINNSTTTLNNATVTLVTDSPLIDCISKDTVSFGTILGGGGTAANDLVNPFVFKVAPAAECSDPSFPPTVEFTLLIKGDGFDGSTIVQNFTLRLDLNDIGTVNMIDENFDVGQGGFTHELGEGDDDGNPFSPDGVACENYVDQGFWNSSGGNPAGAFFVYDQTTGTFPGEYADLLDTEIISPVMVVPAGGSSASVTFDHRYQFQSTATLLPDGARVDYRINGGAWTKVLDMPYDGPLIFNTYCNPLCNNLGEVPCFSENGSNGENVFARLDSASRPWTTVAGTISGLVAGDELEVRWRVGSMNLTFFGFPKDGGYALDNVVIDAQQQECDTAINLDEGCGVVFDGAGNLVQLCGNNNAVVEPSEIWSVDIDLKNVGSNPATATVADLAINVGSVVNATVLNPNGDFGTIAPDATATVSYQFEVEDPAVCLNDITFDVNSIADSGRTYPDETNAFAVGVGAVSFSQLSSQFTDPINASGSTAMSDLAPPFTITSADTASLSYDFSYDNPTESEIARQDTTLSNVANTSAVSTMSPSLTFAAGTAGTAVFSCADLTYTGGNLDRCTQVALRTPNGTDVVFKDFDTPNVGIYDATSVYNGVNGGPGQYSVVLSERSGGGCNSPAGLRFASLDVETAASTGTWTSNVQVSLFDGTTSTVLKGFGVADANPYDVAGLYTGPGTYRIDIEEAGGGGIGELTGADMQVVDQQCDSGCSGLFPPAPPVGDGVVGNFMTVERGAGANDLIFDIDNATCSDDHAVVLYGNIGDYSNYVGAIDVGCDIGAGQNAAASHLGGNVWFNVIWVNLNDAGGNPGQSTAGTRSWSSTGLCNVVAEDVTDGVCD